MMVMGMEIFPLRVSAPPRLKLISLFCCQSISRFADCIRSRTRTCKLHFVSTGNFFVCVENPIFSA